MGFDAYGFRFPTRRAARRYKALVLTMERSGLDPRACERLGSRFISLNGGEA